MLLSVAYFFQILRKWCQTPLLREKCVIHNDMSRRRKYKRNKKPDLIFEFLAPVILLFAGLFAFQHQILGVIDLKMFESVLPLYRAIFLLLGVVLIGVFISNALAKLIEKLERDRLVRKQYMVNDWFSMDPNEFEHFIAGVYEKRGYTVDEVTSYVADHGIDVALRRNGKRYAIQVKQYKNKPIGEKDLREFYGSYVSDFDGGSFVTTSTYTKPAKEWAKGVGMLLVDGDYLVKMVNKT